MLLSTLAALVLSAGPPGPAPITAASASEVEAHAIADDPRVVFVTGSTSGLGEEVARRMAARGAHVIVHGRNVERGNAVVRDIEGDGGSASFYRADFASLEDVRELASTVLERYDRLDVLVNNAGVGSAPGGERWESEDGYEFVFQVNYLSHVLLTDLLLERIVQSAPARIVNVASIAQSPIDFDDVMLEEPGAISRAYGQSKLAQIFHAFDLAEELEETGVVVNALHPATFMDTRMVEQAGIPPQSTVDEGADAVMQLILEPVGSGRFFNGLEPEEADAQAYDADARERLRELTRELVGL